MDEVYKRFETVVMKTFPQMTFMSVDEDTGYHIYGRNNNVYWFDLVDGEYQIKKASLSGKVVFGDGQ